MPTPLYTNIPTHHQFRVTPKFKRSRQSPWRDHLYWPYILTHLWISKFIWFRINSELLICEAKCPIPLKVHTKINTSRADWRVALLRNRTGHNAYGSSQKIQNRSFTRVIKPWNTSALGNADRPDWPVQLIHKHYNRLVVKQGNSTS